MMFRNTSRHRSLPQFFGGRALFSCCSKRTAETTSTSSREREGIERKNIFFFYCKFLFLNFPTKERGKGKSHSRISTLNNRKEDTQDLLHPHLSARNETPPSPLFCDLDKRFSEIVRSR